jgi:hypothetical protein
MKRPGRMALSLECNSPHADVELETLLRRLDEDPGPGYLSAPYPCVLDDEIARLIERFAIADDGERARLCERRLTRQQSMSLLHYGERMAYLAVRKVSVSRVFQGLLALALENARLGVSESVPIVVLLYSAAKDIHVDPTDVFHRAALFARPEMARIMGGFAKA